MNINNSNDDNNSVLDYKTDSLDSTINKMKNMLSSMIFLSEQENKDFLFEINTEFEKLYTKTFSSVNNERELIFDQCRKSCILPYQLGVEKNSSIITAKKQLGKINELYPSKQSEQPYEI